MKDDEIAKKNSILKITKIKKTAIKRIRTKSKRWKKLKNNEIENNLQVKINFSNLKITTKRRGTKSKGETIWKVSMIFSRDNTQFKVNEREKKGKKEINMCQTR